MRTAPHTLQTAGVGGAFPARPMAFKFLSFQDLECTSLKGEPASRAEESQPRRGPYIPNMWRKLLLAAPWRICLAGDAPRRCRSGCGTLARSISWELVRNAPSQTPLRVGPSHLDFSSPARILAQAHSRPALQVAPAACCCGPECSWTPQQRKAEKTASA